MQDSLITPEVLKCFNDELEKDAFVGRAYKAIKKGVQMYGKSRTGGKTISESIGKAKKSVGSSWKMQGTVAKTKPVTPKTTKEPAASPDKKGAGIGTGILGGAGLTGLAFAAGAGASPGPGHNY